MGQRLRELRVLGVLIVKDHFLDELCFGQHDVSLLGQEVGLEALVLRDELRGGVRWEPLAEIHGACVHRAYEERNESVQGLEGGRDGSSHRGPLLGFACRPRTFVTEHEVDEVSDDIRPLQHVLGCCQARLAYVEEHLEEGLEPGPALRALLGV